MKSIQTHACGVSGCVREIQVLGTLLRAGLQAIEPLTEVYKVDMSDVAGLMKIVRSLRGNKLGMLSLSSSLSFQATSFADELGPSAERTSCVNMLMSTSAGIFGHDIHYDTWQDRLAVIAPPRSTALILGTGPAAVAAVAACRQLDFQLIGITTRSWISTEKLHDSPLADRFRQMGALPVLWPMSRECSASSRFSQQMRLQFGELASSAQALIQTIAVSPSSEDARLLASVIPWTQTRQDAVVCDLIYGASTSPFLAEAQRRGLTGIGGIEILTMRGLRIIETWTGQSPPRQLIHAAALDACARLSDE
ncbi:MAG TPA: hypothetical protein PLJ27_19545 [Polyangiaceae bacterium]|jgi:shikimate 5-dehydrogenase|nr:MAG: shikimate 5-dehydrogenase [Deltaproteobacteria bacterium ADurb.Bin207]HNS95571.1 hypothetical protein [Polyangiaceae bacterium]HNZ21343.1 hypothetical protein [Polyangiaceae bacterium]HOD24785.1 hypothetical protein [Polyangiaceae bacterium]HOE47482.1 hypothetical protein [Polyangiaceae bacterium]